ncbi:hypothetical protein NEOLEDRAFT_1178075 [Neolentinus lepideus HHB14362 ss-1]|uniref:DUF6534 domain-containing protein n=1 Tax=Neolentinus lepideus HHB14362 ss-1 TaxID=1314782 RepID=A0A165T0P9_9AGAM|nr:hypothetical protein NEOLEDRAFT_1178075 [Neolentinus lepideus HHB14362 ss-1]
MRLSGVPKNVTEKLGPLLIAYLLAYLFQGVLIVQIYAYCTSTKFSADRWPVKVTLWVVCVTELVCTLFVTASAWYGLVCGWGDPDTLRKQSWALSFVSIPNGLVAFAVQIFFCWRMVLLNREIIIPGLIAMISLGQVAMAVIGSVHMFSLPDIYAVTSKTMYWMITAYYVGCAACDILIALNMVRLLSKAKRQSEFPDTHSLLARQIKICVHTGIVTACSSIIHVVTFLVAPHGNVHFVFLFIAAKIYSNTLLAILNARKDGSDVISWPASSIEFAHPATTYPGGRSVGQTDMESQAIPAMLTSVYVTTTPMKSEDDPPTALLAEDATPNN